MSKGVLVPGMWVLNEKGRCPVDVGRTPTHESEPNPALGKLHLSGTSYNT